MVDKSESQGDRDLSTPALRAEAMREYFIKHGIPSANRTSERLGQTSITFSNSPFGDSEEEAEQDRIDESSDPISHTPSPESIDRAETALHYHNQRKGH